ncbi:MAG: GGDEF domain-containing protein, partial [Chloroflexota bacterium]|nr:GGDEF domain-containing protein [Chloroflexota bacterium]
ALVRAAWTDPLTGLLNRAALLHGVEGAVTVAQTAGETLALLFADVDHFKAHNDRHGHHIGDQLLHACAATMRATLPEAALLGRYGGEEFVAVAPGVSRDAGNALAERLRRAIAGHGDLRVTISVGVAHYPGDGRDGEALLRAADRALYAAKAAGRNCVRRADEATPV